MRLYMQRSQADLPRFFGVGTVDALHVCNEQKARVKILLPDPAERRR